MSKRSKNNQQPTASELRAFKIAVLTGRSLLWPANWLVALTRDEELMSKARNRVLKGGLLLTTLLIAWLAYFYLPAVLLSLGVLLPLAALYVIGIVLSVFITWIVYDEMVAYENHRPLLPTALAKFANAYFAMRFFWSVIIGVAVGSILRIVLPIYG